MKLEWGGCSRIGTNLIWRPKPDCPAVPIENHWEACNWRGGCNRIPVSRAQHTHTHGGLFWKKHVGKWIYFPTWLGKFVNSPPRYRGGGGGRLGKYYIFRRPRPFWDPKGAHCTTRCRFFTGLAAPAARGASAKEAWKGRGLSLSIACLYGCMYVCTYVCMYICMYVCMYVCMLVCLYACMLVCMHVRM